jgi:L,D-peptidoglycan transpeptidase YkuD (ErfK/YbiS/YcfS/YnhG family)
MTPSRSPSRSASLLRGFAAPAALALVLVACGSAGSPSPSSTSAPEPGAAPAAPAAADGVALGVTVDGTGRVVSEPAGIDCPGQCDGTFPVGATVTLTSTPAEGWMLHAWSGACAGAGTCSVVLDAAASVTSALALVDPRWDPAVGAADCTAAWGTAGETLSACDKTKDRYVVVHKSKRNVALCDSGKLVKNLRSGLGFAPSGDKVKEGDGKTPEGVFFVPTTLPNSTYYKAFLLSYPLPEDAKRGVAAGLITADVGAQIESAHAACTEPSQDTALGGAVEIHGKGSSQDWTAGCVALDDAGVDLLWSAIGVGDTIVVLP